MRKQENPYRVRWIVLESGERLPLLQERATGEPVYQPALYVLTQLRAKNLASATIDQALRAITVLCLFLKARKIDLDERILRGQLLSLVEIEALARSCRLSVESLARCEVDGGGPPQRKVTSLERARMRRSLSQTGIEVGAETAAIRGLYITGYLRWYVDWRVMGSLISPHPDLSAATSRCLSSLREHLPSKRWRNIGSARKGLAETNRRRILEVIDPASQDNPWSRDHCRQRNRLIVLWLLHLGVRSGEILGLQIPDINFQSNEVLVARRADDIEDPRRNEPNTKTSDRLLPLSNELAALTRDYILTERRRAKGAQLHKYLLVATGSGAPLSKAAFNKIFVTLQKKCPELEAIHPHLFRHTWNDEFSKQMDRMRIPEERERKLRSVLMGWSPTSGSAATYTRRHIERTANKASLEMQNGLMRGQPDDAGDY
jgi:integrase